MKRHKILPILAVAACAPTCASAASAPPQLYGKSLNLSWTTTRTFTEEGVGRTSSNTASMRVYISSKGRIFSQRQFERGGGAFHRGGGGRGGSGRTVTGPQEVAGEGSNVEVREWRMEGHSLVAYRTFGQGARRLSVDFDPSFTTCTLQVTFAKEAASGRITQRGGRREVLSINVGSTSCSIEAGNVFAGH